MSKLNRSTPRLTLRSQFELLIVGHVASPKRRRLSSIFFEASMGGRKKLIKSINNKFILFLAFHISIKPEAIRRVNVSKKRGVMWWRRLTMIQGKGRKLIKKSHFMLHYLNYNEINSFWLRTFCVHPPSTQFDQDDRKPSNAKWRIAVNRWIRKSIGFSSNTMKFQL